MQWYTVGRSAKWHSLFVGNLVVSDNIKDTILFNSVILPLCNYLKEILVYIYMRCGYTICNRKTLITVRKYALMRVWLNKS